MLVGAGDIAMCDRPEVAATPNLLDRFPGTVFAAGDNAYPNGSEHDYATCYDPTWGRHKWRTRPAPGNHEYDTPGAAGYFTYFGGRAGPVSLGYYSYNEGSWLVVSLNSNIAADANSAQVQWLRSILASSRNKCTAAYWHHPYVSSGPNGDNPHMGEIWRALYEADAELVVVGHDHMYERFAPQDRNLRADPKRGVREFVVGTGGAYLYSPRSIKANSEIRASEFGVLKLTLKPDSYEWEFVPIEGGTFRDFGSAGCH
ncbi:MAG: metallophosphoesterase [Acidobacteria bacterium]|nr:metallophosphoesterase [Acidobacteriota bacterium]